MSPPRRPGTPKLLRAVNDRAALELLLEQGPLTRTRLGELTGLSKVAASQLVERLVERGLVMRAGEEPGSPGPNAQLFSVDPTAAYVVGVSLSAGRAVAACADIAGTVAARVEQDGGATGDPVGLVHTAVARAAGEAQTPLGSVRRVVLGTPGPVAPATGDLTSASGLPGSQPGLRAALRDHLHVPVAFENDVNLAAVAEARLGAARDAPDFVLVWVDAGVGLAVVLDGRLHLGSTGAAGEVGYLPVPGAPDSSGPTQAPFQQLAGLHAVRAVAREHGFEGPGAGPVRAAVAAGPRGAAVLDELARRLALGVAAACVVLDPPLVVLAGAVGQAGGPALAERVRREVTALTRSTPRVVVGEIAAEPVLTGALHTALAAVRDEVFGSTVP